MRPIICALAAGLCLAVGGAFALLPAAAGQDTTAEPAPPAPTAEPPQPVPQPYWERHGCARPVSGGEYTRRLRRVYRFGDRGGDYWASNVTPRQLARLAHMRRCALSPRSRAWRRRQARSRAADWRFHREIDRITPWGEWAIPTYIVMCESGGVYTKWNYGGSGASGAYQIMGRTWAGHGGLRWASAAAYAPDYAQHIVAARIWASGGASQWSCS